MDGTRQISVACTATCWHPTKLVRVCYSPLDVHCLPCPCRLNSAPPSGHPSQHARLLSSLIDLPTLLDACALYGAHYGPQLGQAVSVAFRMLPSLYSDLASAAVSIADNVKQVVAACRSAVGRVEADATMLQGLQGEAMAG